jgi:hypothetical protein
MVRTIRTRKIIPIKNKIVLRRTIIIITTIEQSVLNYI